MIVTRVEVLYPDGQWHPDPTEIAEDGRPDSEDAARRLAEMALRLAIRYRATRRRAAEQPSLPLRATVRHGDEVLVELETGDALHDAATEARIRPATWTDLDRSMNAIDGVFELDGRRVYVL